MQQSPVCPQPPPEKHHRKRRFMRIVRGYLMLVGACTTIYALVRLVIALLVEARSWGTLIP
jgi:hypothetical protein